jgi:DNA-directed RNA polymerase specialized sigma24 family protein
MAFGDSSVTLWMQQFLAGDNDIAIQRLWERYCQRLVALAARLMGDLPRRVADDEDVAISAFGSFCHGVARGRFAHLKGRDDLWRLLVTITARKANHLRDYLNCEKRGDLSVLDQPALAQAGAASANTSLDQFLAADPTPEFISQAAEEYQRLLNSLPNDEIRSVAQWKMEGFTNAEMATKLDCTPRSVQRRLHLIRLLWTKALTEDPS